MKAFAAAIAIVVLAQAGQRPATPALRLRELLQPLGAEPIEVLEAEKVWSGPEVFFTLLQSEDRAIRAAALSAIGRLQNPTLVPRLLALKDMPAQPLMDAVASSLHGMDPLTQPALLEQVFNRFYIRPPFPVMPD